MVATHGLFRMEEVKNPVLNSLEADAKLVDSIPQKIGLGPQLVPYRAQPLQSEKALVLCFCG